MHTDNSPLLKLQWLSCVHKNPQLFAHDGENDSAINSRVSYARLNYVQDMRSQDRVLSNSILL